MSDLPELAYCRPRHVDEALAALARPGARIYAGGTDLLVALTRRTWPSALTELVDVKGLEATHGIVDAGDVLRIGAAVTAAELAASRLIRREAGALAQAAGLTSSPALRHRGTVGGNIVTPHPAGDVTTALLALGATVEIAGAHATEEVPLADVVTTDPRARRRAWPRTRLILAVRVRKSRQSAFEKLHSGAAFSRSLVAVATSVRDGEVSVALGGMHVRPFLAARTSDAASRGGALRAALREESRPPEDGLASRAYRLQAAEALIERTLARLGAR